MTGLVLRRSDFGFLRSHPVHPRLHTLGVEFLSASASLRQKSFGVTVRVRAVYRAPVVKLGTVNASIDDFLNFN